MSPRALLGRLALLVGGLLVGLLLADQGARLISPHGAADLLFGAPDDAPQGMYLTDPELVYRPKPGFEGTLRSLGYRVPLRFNDLGLRGPALPAQGTRPRWLAVGDSFTLSPQVPEAETFEGRVSAQGPVELLNAGVDGYSTWQATRRYQELAEEVALDGVLLTFFLGNDYEDNRRFRSELDRARSRPSGQPIARRDAPPHIAWLRRHSYLYGQWWVKQRVAALARPDSPERGRWLSELELFTRQGERRRNGVRGETERALEELKRATTQRGQRLLVAVAPPAFVIDPARVAPTLSLVGLDPATAELEAPAALLLDILRRMDIDACDLSPALHAAGDPASLYFTWDGHWTPRGHAVVADALAACLQAGDAGPAQD